MSDFNENGKQISNYTAYSDYEVNKKPQELLKYAESLGIENASGLRKQEIYFSVLKKFAEKKINEKLRKGYTEA